MCVRVCVCVNGEWKTLGAGVYLAMMTMGGGDGEKENTTKRLGKK